MALLAFKVDPLPGGGARLEWSTDPVVGPEGIAGYRLYRSSPTAVAETRGEPIGPSLIRTNRYVDPSGSPGSAYRLAAVDGLGGELELGRVKLPAPSPLAAWPRPYRGGTLHVSFASANALGNIPAVTDVSLFDIAGRHVRTLANGEFARGFHTATWDGLDATGRPAPSGIYFLRLHSAGQTVNRKIVVAR